MPKATRFIQVLLLVTLTVTVFGCQTVKPPQPDMPWTIEVQGLYTHPLSGMQFPEQVGPFERKRIRRYDATGHKLGVRYALARTGQDVVASIRIYPGPGTGDDLQDYMQHQFDAIKAHIVYQHSDASLLFSGEIRLKRKGEILQGKKASFQFEDIFSYKVEQLLSHAYLFARGKWFMEFRVTYPQAQHDDVHQEVSKFLRSFLWKEGA